MKKVFVTGTAGFIGFHLAKLLLEEGYAYGFKILFKINGKYREQPETFKFRVD